MLGGCGVEGAPTETPRPASEDDLSADEILSRAREAAAAVTSYRYVWDMTRRIETPDREPSIIDLHEEGRWLAPSDFFADTVVAGNNVDRHYQEINVDDIAYLRYLPGDGWHVHSPSQRRGAPDVPGAGDWEIADPNASFDGHSAYYLTGTQERTDEMQRATTDFEIYVRKLDFLPLSVGTRNEGQFAEEHGSEHYVMEWTTRYFAFNEPVTIEPPPDATPVPTPRRRAGS